MKYKLFPDSNHTVVLTEVKQSTSSQALCHFAVMCLQIMLCTYQTIILTDKYHLSVDASPGTSSGIYC